MKDVLKSVKGGTGSGDVNACYTDSIYEGLKNAGFEITTENWLMEYDNAYETARNIWKENIPAHAAAGTSFFEEYSAHVFSAPAESSVFGTITDTAVYVIMTDWMTTMNDPECTAAGCMIAGNDLIMPGLPLRFRKYSQRTRGREPHTRSVETLHYSPHPSDPPLQPI